MIRKYVANADNSIFDAYMGDLLTRGTGSNAGRCDILEIFGMSNRQSLDSGETSRVLLNFPIEAIEADRSASLVPASGSVKFFLDVYNAQHTETLPRNFILDILPLSSAFEEGEGMHVASLTSLGSLRDMTYDATGSNWIRRKGSTSWSTPGGDWLQTSNEQAQFDKGDEDMSVDVTDAVESWLRNDMSRNGFILKLVSAQEPMSGSINSSGSQTNFYTKRFFGRDSEFFFKRPTITAKWDSSIRDSRGSFLVSSSALSNNDNLSTLYLYNYVKGQLKDIEGIGDSNIYVTVLDDISSSVDIAINPSSPVTGGWVSTGIYSASFAVSTTASTLSDKWHNSADTTTYYRGEFDLEPQQDGGYTPNPQYITSITNLQSEYSRSELARFRVFIKEKNKAYNIYRVATAVNPTITIESGSYEVFRVIDNLPVISFGTGSTLETRLSYDVSGNYFDIPMNLLQEDYSYGIRLAYYNGSQPSWVVQPEEWKIRVRS